LLAPPTALLSRRCDDACEVCAEGLLCDAAGRFCAVEAGRFCAELLARDPAPESP